MDYKSGRIYAKVRDGKLTRLAPEPSDPDSKAGLAAVAAELSRGFPIQPQTSGPQTLEQVHTLGSWGSESEHDFQI